MKDIQLNGDQRTWQALLDAEIYQISLIGPTP